MACRVQTFVREAQLEDVGRVARRELDLIVVLGTLENLCERCEVDTKRHWPVAAELGKRVLAQVYGYQGDVRVVHRLQFLYDDGDALLALCLGVWHGCANVAYQALLVTLKVGIRDELFDSYGRR